MSDMSKPQDRTVYRDPKTQEWVNKPHNPVLGETRHDKQGPAVDRAKDMLRNQGGGELTIVGRDKLIRSKDTVAPGRDPFPPRDKEH
jgi:hypothetical protein